MRREDAVRRKAEVRRVALAARAGVPDKQTLSALIAARVEALPEFLAARAVMTYIATDVEVQTRPLIERAWADGKRLFIPYCAGGDIRLFAFTSFAQLAPGMLGILEPRRELLADGSHAGSPLEIDVALVPGVAFDRRGGRVGFGKGYYDRFLVQLRPDARTVGLSFECQVFDMVPMLPHDVMLHRVVTETAIYPHGATP